MSMEIETAHNSMALDENNKYGFKVGDTIQMDDWESPQTIKHVSLAGEVWFDCGNYWYDWELIARMYEKYMEDDGYTVHVITVTRTNTEGEKIIHTLCDHADENGNRWHKINEATLLDLADEGDDYVTCERCEQLLCHIYRQTKNP